MSSLWNVSGTQATHAVQDSEFFFDAGRPQDGVRLQREAASAKSALQIIYPGDANSPEPVSECYARGRDLVVAYKQLPTRTVRPHLYYRVAHDQADLTAIQCILSVQTSLLDCAPTTIVQSTAPADEVLVRTDDDWGPATPESVFSAMGFLARRSESPSFFQLLHPSDLYESSCQSNGEDHTMAFRLFPESLEKGVIRRGRILAGWCDRDRDLEIAERCFQEQAVEAPPLTT